MISYQTLVDKISNKAHYDITIKSSYFVINVPGTDFHITVYRDQWDDYYRVTGLPYHLFHVSSNTASNKCSSYFWTRYSDNIIKKIPKKYFTYNQPVFDFYSSTRYPCQLKKIMPHLKIFQKILLKIEI